MRSTSPVKAKFINLSFYTRHDCRLFFMILLYIFISLNTGAQGFLKAEGKRIVNEKGENVLLRGMGLGGWMLQEGYMLRISGAGQQHKIRERIAALLSP